VYSIQLYGIKLVSDLRQVGVFSLGTPVSSTNIMACYDITEILLKVALNTIKQQQQNQPIRTKFGRNVPLMVHFRNYCILGLLST